MRDQQKSNNINIQVMKAESGNVLFLILIAVALFAALSYAVTSSTNSGSGGTGEGDLVKSAAITQYPAAIKTAIFRMMVSKSVEVTSLAFDLPPFDDLDNTDHGVFHPDGGGASYTKASSDVMADDKQGLWYFNYDFEVVNISTTEDGEDGNEIMAFLPGIKESICNKINSELGIEGDTRTSVALDIKEMMDEDDYRVSTANPASNAIGSDTGADGLDGQPYGCFDNNGNEFVYYHVLIER